MKDYKKIFIDFLKTRELKFTPEREEILNAVFSIHRHFDVEDLYQLLREQAKNISHATIYRVIPLLIESHLIKESLRCLGKVSYEHIFGHGHHDHLVCINCGKVVEFNEEQIEKLQLEVCKKYGFKPVEHHLGIKGYCERCQKKK